MTSLYGIRPLSSASLNKSQLLKFENISCKYRRVKSIEFNRNDQSWIVKQILSKIFGHQYCRTSKNDHTSVELTIVHFLARALVKSKALIIGGLAKQVIGCHTTFIFINFMLPLENLQIFHIWKMMEIIKRHYFKIRLK